MLHFPSVKFALHHVCYNSRARFFLHFLLRVNGFKCASVSEQSFFFLSFFLDSGAPGGQRWRGVLEGGRKRGFGRKEGEEKESAEGRERARERVVLKRGAMLIWEKCKQHV